MSVFIGENINLKITPITISTHFRTTFLKYHLNENPDIDSIKIISGKTPTVTSDESYYYIHINDKKCKWEIITKVNINLNFLNN